MTALEVSARLLTPEHRALLVQGSGLTDEVIDRRGYYSISRAGLFARYASGEIVREATSAQSGIVIPVIRPDGQEHCEIIRLVGLPPGHDKLKYVWPTGKRNALDIHPAYAQFASDPSVPLVVTEGIKKGDSIVSRALGEPVCVVSINGCWGWVSSENGASRASVDWRDIGLTEKRRIILVPDSDYALNPDVRKGWDNLATYLQSKTGEGRVQIAPVPPKGLEKQGADDFLLENTLEALLSLARHPSFVDEVTQSTVLTAVSAWDILNSEDDNLNWVVDRLLPERAVLVMAGHTSSFKTWTALALSLDCIFGINHLGHPALNVTRPQRVLYINKEMGRPMVRERLGALIASPRYAEVRERRSDFDTILQDNFAFLDDALVDLAQPEIVNSLVQTIQAHGTTVTILDTLSMVWTGDENSARDVGNFFSTLRLISQLTGTSWVILHHLLKPSKEKQTVNPVFAVRGSGQIVQQADSAILLSLGEPNPAYTEIHVVHGKSRNDRELPAYIAHFGYDPDSTVRPLEYRETVEQELARQVEQENRDEEQIILWMEQVCYDTVALRHRGMRQTHLVDVFRSQWPDHFDRPSDRTLQRRLSTLIDNRVLQRDGYYYRIQQEEEGTTMVSTASSGDDR